MKNERPALDCANCIHKDTCPNVKPGTFCPSFASKAPANVPADNPNTRWRSEDTLDR